MTGILNILAGSIAAAIKDGYFNLVTLLLPGNGTNGAQNNTFLDSSTNNFSITRNGNTTQGTFSPFSQTGWGMYLNGTSYVQPSGSTTTLLGGVLSTSSVFTIEGWFNVPGSIVIAGDLAATSNNNTFAVNIDSSGYPTLGWWNGSSYTTRTGTVVAPFNTWNHIAWVVTGGNVYFYVNGVSAGSAAIGNSSGSPGTIVLGGYNNSFSAGYYSNFRICKSAVYSGAFTPSTTPLTTSSQGATNCTLLTFQSNRFLDNSSTANTFTLGGTPSVQAFSPFAPTAAYSAATNGGSGYFDGSGDYVTCPSSTGSPFDFGTGNFTIEGWFYASASSVNNANLFGISQGGGASQKLNVLIDANAALQIDVNGTFVGASANGYANTNFPNRWVHVALVRSGTGTNQLTLYVNGAVAAQATSSANFTSFTQPFCVGRVGEAYLNSWTGYISNFRIVKGTAVYTGAFTPPTAPLTAITNTSLLLNFTNGGIIDATGKNVLETVGNAQISTTQSKFGGSSMYFDGTGDWLQIPYTATNDLGGTTAFTIEFWVYASSINPRSCVISRNNGSTAAGSQFDVNIETTGQVSTNFYSSSSAIQPVSATGVITTNTWVHVAITKDSSGSYRIFINGTQSGSTVTNTSSINSPSLPILVGVTSSSGNNPFNGYIDDFRITKGYARYTANFTAPTAAFPLS